MNLITVASFSKPEEAHLLRLRLEAGDVAAFIQNENLVQMDWMFSNTIGGVRVQIDEEDIERAKEILADEPAQDSPADWPTCPRCNSRSSAPYEFPRRFSFFLILVGLFPFIYSRRQWHCQDCRNIWKI